MPVEEVLLKALSKAIDERFESASAFVEALDAIDRRLSRTDATDPIAEHRAERGWASTEPDPAGAGHGWFDGLQHGNTSAAPEIPIGGDPLRHVFRETLVDVVQRPATLLPLVSGALAVTYLIAFEAIWGGLVPALLVAVIAPVVAVVSAAFAFSTAFDARSEANLRQEESLRQERLARSIEDLYEALDRQYESIGFDEGLKTLRGLRQEYMELIKALEHRKDVDPAVLSAMPSLANQAFTSGLSALSDALEVLSVVRTSGTGRLQQRVSRIEKELGELGDAPDKEERTRMLRANLADRQQRLVEIAELESSSERLFDLAERCSGALQTGRIRLASMRTSHHEVSVENVSSVLVNTIELAKEVQQEVQEQMLNLDRRS